MGQTWIESFCGVLLSVMCSKQIATEAVRLVDLMKCFEGSARKI